MIYSNKPEYDLLIHPSSTGPTLVCVFCPIYNIPIHKTSSTQEMIEHINAHRDEKHSFPENLCDDLIRDDSVNFPNNRTF